MVFGPVLDNEAPVANADAATVDEDDAVAVDVLGNDTDPDGDALSVSGVGSALNGDVTNNGDDVTYTPNANYCGADSFEYTVSDGNGGSDTGTVNVTVDCVNDLPVAVDDSASVGVGGSVDIAVLANDMDVDGSGMSITSVTNGANGTVTYAGSTVTYTHDGSDTVSDSFTYTMEDGEGDASTATVNVTIGTASAGPPNFVILIADDIGIDVASDLYPELLDDLAGIYGTAVYGNPASMPVTVERIAEQGVVFSNAWAQPVCSPTRAALITGLYAAKTGVTAPGSPLPDAPFSFVDRLSEQGWRTALFGKWHLGTNTTGVLPQEAGFDLFRGHTGGGIEDFWNYNYQVQDELTQDPSVYRTDPTPTKSLPGIGATTFAPVVKVADAIETINEWEAEAPDAPWLVWLAFNEAHWPMHVPNADTLDAPSLAEVTGCGGTPGTNTRGSCNDAVLVRAMTNAMDTVIEHLIDTVEAVDPNTYVIFIGDNGTESDSIENMYLTTSGRGKGTVYESGARVALAISGPGIEPGGESAEFTHAADLFATVLDLAGLDVPTENFNSTGAVVASDSMSLAPILLGHSTSVRDPDEGYILTETSWQGNKTGARNAEYKIVCNGNTSNCTFYDMIDDPLEEFPLDKPASCVNFRSTWSTADPEWHYCRLLEVVASESIL